MVSRIIYICAFISLVALTLQASEKNFSSNSFLSGGWTQLDGARVGFDDIVSLKDMQFIHSDRESVSLASTNAGAKMKKVEIKNNFDGILTFFNFFIPDDSKTVRILFSDTWPLADIYVDDHGPFGGTSKSGIGFIHEQFELGKRMITINKKGALVASAAVQIERDQRQYECIGKELKCNVSHKYWKGR